ncbi:MAG TPA: hypothetical protein VID30_20725 [Bradyrhizobium sp.]|jgi:hypothetical protein
MPKPLRSVPSRQESRIFLTSGLLPKPNVWTESGQAIVLAHRAPLLIGFAARTMITLVLMLVVRLGWTGLPW